MKDQGFPSSEKRNRGSKLNRSLPTERSNMAAGFPSEKVGINDIPLFVTDAAPEMFIGVPVLSVFCENAFNVRHNKTAHNAHLVVFGEFVFKYCFSNISLVISSCFNVLYQLACRYIILYSCNLPEQRKMICRNRVNEYQINNYDFQIISL